MSSSVLQLLGVEELLYSILLIDPFLKLQRIPRTSEWMFTVVTCSILAWCCDFVLLLQLGFIWCRVLGRHSWKSCLWLDREPHKVAFQNSETEYLLLIQLIFELSESNSFRSTSCPSHTLIYNMRNFDLHFRTYVLSYAKLSLSRLSCNGPTELMDVVTGHLKLTFPNYEDFYTQ